LTNNQANHNTKIKSRERKQAIKTNKYLIKNTVAQPPSGEMGRRDGKHTAQEHN
jgi:hypothetical protein